MMDNSVQNWKDTQKTLDQLKPQWEEENTEVPISLWALKNKKISHEDYAHWASNHYQLPFLKPTLKAPLLDEKTWNTLKSKAEMEQKHVTRL